MPAQHLINPNLFEAGYLFAYSRQGGGVLFTMNIAHVNRFSIRIRIFEVLEALKAM